MRQYLKLLMLVFLMVMGKNVAWAEGDGETTTEGETTSTISIPNNLGEYIDATKATLNNSEGKTDKIKAESAAGFGSIYNGATATFTLTASEQLDDAYLMFMTATKNNDCKVTVEVTADDYSKSQEFDILNINDWDFTKGTKRVLYLGTLPKGTVTLKFSFSNTSSYVGNLGNIAFYQSKQFPQEPEAYIDLTKGSYSISKAEENTKDENVSGGYQVGFVKNNAQSAYDIFVTEAGKYYLCLGCAWFANAATMNVKVIDPTTGKEEVSQAVAITSDIKKKDYSVHIPILLESSLSRGWKTLQLSFSGASADNVYIMNYANLHLTKADHTLAVTDAKAATLVLPFEATIPSGVKAYKLTAVGEDNKITCEEVSETLPANTPVLVNAEAGSYTFEAKEVPATAEESPKAGLLTGAFAETTVPQNSYVLQKQNNKVAFYKVSSDKIKVQANRAYLTTPTSNAKELSVDFGWDDVTGISTAVQQENTTDTPLYDLQGKKVSKGGLPKIYITKGKKFVSRK